uniref:DUF6534 domain-containing protein n=1 Tax=Mycena chlorophos TaxID=658473 RepID=A0ABQ0MC96_MYCCL|nr:predicted protein [Mycena chlorophos]
MSDILFLSCLEIGILLAAILLGMATVQTFVYYSNFDDSTVIKLLVESLPSSNRRLVLNNPQIFLIWLVEMVHGGAACYDLYGVTVSRYGHLDLALPPELCAAVILGGVVHPVVQGIFTTRIYQLGHNAANRCLTAVLWGLCGFGLGATVLLAVKMLTGSGSSLAVLEQQWSWLILTLFGANAAANVLIAGALAYYTRGHMPDVNYLDRLALWTAQTGLFMALTSISVLVMFAWKQQNHLWFALLVLSTGVYSNSLLSLLNGRLHFGYQADMPFSISLSATQQRQSHNFTPVNIASPPPQIPQFKPPTPMSPAFNSPYFNSPYFKPASLGRSSFLAPPPLGSPKVREFAVGKQ